MKDYNLYMTTSLLQSKSLFTLIALTLMVSVMAIFGLRAHAAPPYTIVQTGDSVRQAIPGESFTMDFTVTNTGETVYSGVKVIFHIPQELSHTNVAPANATLEDDIVSWSNVPISAGGTFKPSLTLMLEKGTPLGTKKNIWVEITGDGMESNSQNFSITAVATKAAASAAPAKADTSLVSKINSIHRAAYDRNPSASEHAYWLGRVNSGDKSSVSALLGAMQYHRAHVINH